MRLSFLFFICFYAGHELVAQKNIPIGTWRTHFSYYDTRHLTDAGSRIYASAEYGLYFFDKEDNSISKISKVDGLQEEKIASLYYDQANKQLLIGYQSGNLDVIRDNEIFNLDLTTTAQVVGSKKINHVVAYKRFAYLSTDFGVLKFDLQSLEVQETYRELGWGAKPLIVNQAAVWKDSLFLATEEGVLAGTLTKDVNLLDYRNWKRYTIADGIPDEPIAIIARQDDKLIAGINNDSLYSYTGQWASLDILAGKTFNAASSGANLLIVHNNALSQITPDGKVLAVQDALITKVNEAILDAAGKVWIADGNNGLISDFKGTFEVYTPSGPYKNKVFRLSSHENTIYALPGKSTLMPEGSREGFYRYQKGTWENFNATSKTHPIPEFNDVVDAAYSNGYRSLFVASAGDGLLQLTENGERIVIDENTGGSPLEAQEPGNVLIPAIAPDNGGLWVLNYGANNPLHFLNHDATWNSYSFKLTQASYPIDILPVQDQVWMSIDPAQGGGIVAFDPEAGMSRYLSEISDNGGLTHQNVNAMVLDKEGLVWVGTDRGIVVFSNPSGIMQGSVNATKPIFENRWLLSDETVTAIKIDGGNRKWIGTTNGVWLFNDAANEELISFTAQSSPLPDNEILDIEINGVTGEVFFATSKGIVSYRGTATASQETHGSVKIFPNPITRDFQGTVGISGLATDAIVKITDTSGKLIWQTEANGGTATWQVADYNGNRATTGIYLVFSASPDGEDAIVGKIAVIN